MLSGRFRASHQIEPLGFVGAWPEIIAGKIAHDGFDGLRLRGIPGHVGVLDVPGIGGQFEAGRRQQRQPVGAAEQALTNEYLRLVGGVAAVFGLDFQGGRLRRFVGG